VRVKTDLLAGEWAVLALLCEAPRHGYELATLLAPDGEIGRVWSLRRPMTYRTLTALERLEFVVEDSVEPGTTAPTRRIMRATAEAQDQVTVWLAQPEEHVRDLRSRLLLKLHFLRRRGETIAPLLNAQRIVLARQAEALSPQREQPDELGSMLAQWRWSMTKAALQFVDLQLAAARSARPG
jgi:DNA-binding PadR family transcriptional regulator